MKSILFTLAFIAFSAMTAQAQPTSGPVMTFEYTIIDYGIIEKGANGIRKLKFTNTGNEPLIIKSAKGSCICVTTTYPQESVMPNESGNIEVKYDTQRLGNFNKEVVLTTNETESTHTLTIKGEVKGQ